MRSSFSISLLYHAYVYFGISLLACTIYILTEEQLLQTADVTLRKYLLHIQEEIKLETLSHFLNMLLVDTFRIKGFVYLEDTWYLVNAVGNMLYIEPCSEKKETQKNILVILSGYGLPTKKAIRKAMEWYPEVVLKIE